MVRIHEGSPLYLYVWSLSSVGRALPLQGRCHKFESCSDHHVHLSKFMYNSFQPFIWS